VRARRLLLVLLYQALATLAFLAALPYVLLRSARHPGEMIERAGWGPLPSGAGPRPLWLHAASLGEVEAIRGLLSGEEAAGNGPAVLTVLSVSARRQAPRKLPRALTTRFAPLDLWFCVLPFLARLKPRALLLAETELWPMTLAACRWSGIPVALVSGRVSDRNWKRTSRFAGWLRPFCETLLGVGAQTEADADRFRRLGAPRVEVTGNLKHDLRGARGSANESTCPPEAGGFPPVDAATDRESQSQDASTGKKPEGPGAATGRKAVTGEDGAKRGNAAARAPGTAGNRPVGGAADPDETAGGPRPFLWVAGSLRRGEETVLDAAARAPGREAILVLAPRHLRELEHWRQACQSRGLRVRLRSGEALPIPPSGPFSAADREKIRREVARILRCDDGPSGEAKAARESASAVLLVDIHGELTAWYAVGEAAFVGGTLVPLGGHNLFEAAREGVPVAFGPHFGGVRDVAEALLGEGAGRCVGGAAELSAWLDELSRDEAARREKGRAALRVARRLGGAGERTRNLLESFGVPLRAG
jgi:3-deoxy-D-manno-octulosonic-acid transferase